MEIIKKFSLLMIILAPFFANGQKYFYTKYRQGLFSQGNGITQLPDSTFAITGVTDGVDSQSSQVFLTLLDTLGHRIWSKAYGGSGEDVGVRVFYIPNDGFLIAGYTGSTPDGNVKFCLWKTDKDGNLQWQKQYGSDNWDILNDAQLFPDGSIVMVGESVGQTTQKHDIKMVRTDALGDTIWTKIIQTPEEDRATCIDTLSDSTFVVGGVMGDGTVSNGFLAKFSLDGTMKWKDTLDRAGKSKVYDIDAGSSTLFIAGHLFVDSISAYTPWRAKYDFNGNYIVHATSSYNGDTYYSSITVNNNNNALYIAREKKNIPSLSLYPYGYDVDIMKLSKNLYYNGFLGNTSSNGDDFINQLIITKSGGVAFVGTCNIEPKGNSLGIGVMVGKVGPNNEWNDTIITHFDKLFDTTLYAGIQKETLSSPIIYPNPAHQIIHISDNFVGYDYRLVSITGKVVSRGKLESSLSVEKIERGIYILCIYSKNYRRNIKVIKK